MPEISDFDLAKDLIRATRTPPVDLADLYVRLSERTGLDFGAAIRLGSLMPNFLAGERHQVVRRAMAGLISGGRDGQRRAVQQAIDAVVDGHFRHSDEVELVADVVLPIWRSLSAQIVEVSDEITELADDIPVLFSSTASIGRRKAVNDRIAALFAEDDGEERVLALALASLGSRPFTGSFGLSIYRTVEAQGPAPARAIDWPTVFPENGIEFIDRMAGEDMEIGGCPVAKGALLSTHVRHASYSQAQRDEILYGLGAHACVGKAISNYAWSLFTGRMKQLDVVLTAGEIAMQPFAAPFYVPARATIRVEA